MQTPWGPLDSLDLNNHELAINILGADKHQLVEGLVVESLFDQIMRDVSPAAVGNYTSLDVETTIVRAPRGPDRWISFVWARTRQAGLRDYLRSLEKSFSTYLLRLEKGYFYATPVREGAINGKDTLPLEELVRRLGTATPKYPVVSDSVRDPQRL